MDNRLLLAVLFVTLSWISEAGANNATSEPNTAMATDMTSAGNSITSEPNATMATDMTSAGNSITSEPNATMATDMTSAGNSITSEPNATMATDMTSAGNTITSEPNATMATDMTSAGYTITSDPNATMATDMTSAGYTITSDPNATMATDMTSAGYTITSDPNATMATDMTSAGNTMTSEPTGTMATHMTTEVPTTALTAVPPLIPNITVENLETTISNTGCGTEQLCAAEPSSCNPASSGSCFFLAAKQQSGQNFDFELSGESEGYLAASLSSDSTLGGNDTTYVCANDNGVVKFIGAVLDNGKLTEKELNVNTVKGKVTGKTIQCTFAATVPDPVARTAGFSVSVSTGTYNSSSDRLGPVNTQLKSPVVDLTKPNTVVINELATNTTTSPNTTDSSYSFTLQQSMTQALLISAGVLSLTMV
ncbi:sericin 1-like [Chelmon rostratus]|uniref:sericin 1-like n=1 Tax=Chelmon rostratus TaxID=109905 RepID=UPI001BE83DA0|nr:sericin 1-like [Chelmon rostratus]XP_041820807.1 sericin 1-like [Chelmon rostratus]